MQALSPSPGLISCTPIPTGHARGQVLTHLYLACSAGEELCFSTRSILGAANNCLSSPPEPGSLPGMLLTAVGKIAQTLFVPWKGRRKLWGLGCFWIELVPIFMRSLSPAPRAAGSAISRNLAGPVPLSSSIQTQWKPDDLVELAPQNFPHCFVPEAHNTDNCRQPGTQLPCQAAHNRLKPLEYRP